VIQLGTDPNFRYLIDVKKQYTVYSLSGEPIRTFCAWWARLQILPLQGPCQQTRYRKAELLTNRTKPSKVETPLTDEALELTLGQR